MAHLRILLCLALVGASACVTAAGAGSSAARGDVIVLGAGGSVEAIDAASGEVRYSMNGVTASSDYSRLYAAQGSTLRTVDARSGRAISSTGIPAGYSTSVVSGDGHAVALVRAADAAPLGAMPGGRTSTRVVVADPSGASKARTYRLRGNFEPEAFSTNDKILFLLDYFPALSPARYQVTRLVLSNGTVSPAFGAVKAPAPKMQGTRVMHVLSPDRSVLFTLYTNQDPSYSGAWGPGEAAFVHTLSLQFGQAVCIDLPNEFGPGPAAAKTLALSPDGSKLYAIDTGAGLISVIDTAKRTVLETKHVDFASSGEMVAAEVGPGGSLYVGSGTRVYVVDPQTLQIIHRWTVAEPVNGIGWAGKHLFVSSSSYVSTLDPSSGKVTDSVSSSGPGIVSVIPAD